MELVLLNVVRVFHVGTLDIRKKVKDSYEGSGLSVSNCPDAWREINRGGTYGETWNIKKPKGGLFVDYHKTLNDETKEELKRWGILNNYIEYCKTYSVEMTDEYGREYFIEFTNKEEAELEAEMYDTGVVTQLGFKATNKMLKEINYRLNSVVVNCYNLLLTMFVEKYFKDVDGVWWEDVYEPESYSAPRGVIFNSKIKEWCCFVGDDADFEPGCQDIFDFEEEYYN